jgi:hypothetical protein
VSCPEVPIFLLHQLPPCASADHPTSYLSYSENRQSPCGTGPGRHQTTSPPTSPLTLTRTVSLDTAVPCWIQPQMTVPFAPSCSVLLPGGGAGFPSRDLSQNGRKKAAPSTSNSSYTTVASC